MSNNLIARWSEVDRLKECPALADVLLQAKGAIFCICIAVLLR